MTDSDTDTDSASPSWDDLSFQRPAAPAVDGTVAPGTDPAVAAAINRMNQGLSAGQSDDEILSNEVGDIGRTGRKVTATTTGDTTDDDKKSKKSDGAPSWDSLSFSKPSPQPTMNQPDKSLMTQPDDEDDLVRASGGEQGTEPEDTTQGPGIGSVIASNLRGAGLSVARAGELAAAGIDQYLSPEDAEKEFKNAQALRDYQKENEVAPVTKGEKAASFASNLVGGLATGGIGGPESEAQDVIEEGGSVKDAEKALAVGTAQQEAMLGTGNLGKTLGTRLATQVPINVGLGAAARAVDGQDAGDSGDIASDIGSGVFGALVPGGEHETKEVKAARKVNEASDQLIKNTETSNADEIPQDQGGVSEAGTQPQSGGESRGEDLQQPAKAESGASDAQQQVTRADLVNRWQNAEGATAQRKAADDLAAYDATNKGDADVDQNVQPPSASGDAEKGASDAGTSAKDEGAPDAGETKPFTPEERSKEKTEAILDKVPGLSDEQKGYLRDNMPAPEKDSVTGYYTRPELKPTIDAAKDSGEPSAYAEVDLRNLGGLNAHVGSNSGADEHYTAMADIIRQEAEKSGAQVVPIRKGGDEMGLVFKGADANTAHQTMLNAQDRIADYATTNGLSDIANPKGGAKGTGIHFGVSDILPEHSTSDIIKRADTLVELRKKGETYEYPRPTEEVGTGERAAGRPGASTEASGVRDAGADGLADDHEQATQGQRSSAAESGADDERAGESGAVDSTDIRNSAFNRMRDEIGWDQQGGRLIREGERADGLKSEVTGRTQWVPKMRADSNGRSDFWPTYRSNEGGNALSEKQAHAAFDKVQAGEKLTPREQRFINYAHDTADRYTDEYNEERTAHDTVSRHEGEPVHEPEAVPMYRTGTASEGVTAPEARDTLKKEFGSTAVRKMEAAGLKISPSSDLAKLSPELSPAERAGVKGVTVGGRPHLIHDQTSAAEIPGTVVHEIWHANADRVLPKTKQEALARAVDKVPGVQSALAKIPGSTNPAHVNAEKVAYALQHLHDNSVGTRALDAIKIGLNRLGVPKNWLDANESLLRRIGSENLKHFQETPRTYQDAGTERAAKPRVKAPSSVWDSQRENAPEVSSGAPNPPRTTTSSGGSGGGSAQDRGIKNADTEAGRAERGKAPIDKNKSAGVSELEQHAHDTLTANKSAGEELAAEVASKPRNLSDKEGALLAVDRKRLGDEYHDANQRAAEATESGDEPAEIQARLKMRELEDKLHMNDLAATHAGTEWSAAGRARQLIVKDDYSLARVITRARAAAGDSKLSDSDRAALEDLISKHEAANDAVNADAQKRASTGTKKTGTRTPKTIDDELKSILGELDKVAPKPETAPLYAREDDVSRIVRKVAKNRVESGIDDASHLVDTVHGLVGDKTGLSKEEVADTISGYGGVRNPTKDEAKIRLNAVRSEMRDLSKTQDILNGKIDPDAAKKRARVTALGSSIDDLQRQIDYGRNAKDGKREPLTNDEIKIIKAQRDDLKKQLDAIYPKDSDAQKNATRQSVLRKEQAKLQTMLDTGNFSKPQKAKPIWNADTLKEQGVRDALRKQVDARIRKIAAAQKGNGEKTVDFMLNWRRAAILAGTKTLGKLSAAASARTIFSPIEEGIGGVLGHIPGLRGIASRAPREGGFSGKAEAAALKHTLSGEMLSEAGNKLKNGIDKLDALFGNKIEHNEDYFRYVGQLHGALKTPAKINEFYRSIEKRGAFERNRLTAEGKMTPSQIDAHMASPETQAWLGAKAYQDANRAIFMGDNRLISSIRLMLHNLEGAPKGSASSFFGKLGSKAFSYEYPIMKVPANFVAETGSYLAGGAKAAIQLALAKGVKNLNGDQADYIMRNLKKQTFGAALMAIGYGTNSVAGYYQQGDNKKKNVPEAGSAKIAGVTVPHFVLHFPQMEAMNIGATYKKVMQKTQSGAEGALAAIKGLFEEVPFVGDRISNQFSSASSVGKTLGNAAREFIPAAVQEYAKATDPAKQRVPRDGLEAFETGLPFGVRENVPTHKIEKPKTNTTTR